jgi:hypothetical protein
VSAVLALLEEFDADPELEALRPFLADHRARLGERLRVAVVGEVNAGKSTLVNALVGRDVAETSGGEQTYVNWWFRGGLPERMRLRRPGGRVDEVALGTPLGELDVSHHAPVQVLLDTPLLADLTVIDTPGLYSLRSDNSEHTKRLIDQGADQSVRGAREADALLYLTATDLPGARDRDTLGWFVSQFGTVRVAPTNALMLLSRADRRAERLAAKDSRSALEQVAELAQRYRSELFSCVWDIAPVSALAASLARCGWIDDEAASQVRALAGATAPDAGTESPSPARRRMLVGEKYLRREFEDRGLSRLVVLSGQGMGLYETRIMLTAADLGKASTAGLIEALEAASGLQPVEELIGRTFAARGEIIQADAALSDLERKSYSLRSALARTAASRVRARCEDLRVQSPQLQDLADARAAVDPAVRLEPDEQVELAALFGGGAAQLPEADAARRASAWMARANAVQTTPQQSGIAMRAHFRYAQMTGPRDERRNGDE